MPSTRRSRPTTVADGQHPLSPAPPPKGTNVTEATSLPARALAVPSGFLWGASTSAHQVEGNNVLSDWWALETIPDSVLPERSGDAADSYHRYPEDMSLLADAGLNAYRFSIEWARIEPTDGHFSRTALDHYRRMIVTAREKGLEPVVTLHHFTLPAWFSKQGGWLSPRALDRFDRYVETATSILADVNWVCTINEPNMVAAMAGLMKTMQEEGAAALTGIALAAPDDKVSEVLIRAHQRAVEIVHNRTAAKVGWTIANQQFEAVPGTEDTFPRIRWAWEDRFLEAARGDDFVGVQAYTTQKVDSNGPVPHEPQPDSTLTGWPYRPDALEIAIRHTAEITIGVPIIVTENGIATSNDTIRIRYTDAALSGLESAITDGIEVSGYLHWSALDNYEWGSWKPTFGLIAVDGNFARHPKPSLAWLGAIATQSVEIPQPA